MARLLDLMICVFPFEKTMYEASGLHTIFAGHPLLEALAREKMSINREDDLVGALPGSREREVNGIFPSWSKLADSSSKNGRMSASRRRRLARLMPRG